MNPNADTRSRSFTGGLSPEAIRLMVNVAQSECVCLLTDAGERAGIQPFLYEGGLPGHGVSA